MVNISKQTIDEIAAALTEELIIPALMTFKAHIENEAVTCDFSASDDVLNTLSLRLATLEVKNAALNDTVVALDAHVKRLQESNHVLEQKIAWLNSDDGILSVPLSKETTVEKAIDKAAKNVTSPVSTVKAKAGGESEHKESILNYIAK